MTQGILSLLGGGAKGIFTLGVLEGVEALLGKPICQHFSLITGTSTGAIIGSLLSLGKTVQEVTVLYRRHIPHILAPWFKKERSRRLREMGKEVLKDTQFSECKTRLSIIATNLTHGRPTIFKSYPDGAWRGSSLYVPGFGVTIREAVEASCAAYPFFEPTKILLRGANHQLIDGGFSANDPSLFALLDAFGPLHFEMTDTHLLTIGTGKFAETRRGIGGWISQRKALRIFAATLETSSSSQNFLVENLYPNLNRCRIPSSTTDSDVQTSLLETNPEQLDKMLECGRAAFRENEDQLRRTLLQ